MRVKHSTFTGIDPNTGESNVHVVKDGVIMQPDMLEFFNSIKINTDDKTYLLFNVMGASDFYGINKNGDAFYEKDLIAYHKTFEQGHVYLNHDNDDPAKSFGKILFASYNHNMHRVELLVELDKHDPRTVKILTMLERGNVPRVSMGCFLAGTPITIDDFSTIPIEKICEGDNVLTHTGELHKVTETHIRPYKGTIYGISPTGKFRDTIYATEEHPWLVVEPDTFNTKDHKCRKIRDKNLTIEDCVWKKSCDIDCSHYLVMPKPKVSGDDIDIATAMMLGRYLAEGHTCKTNNGIVFSVHQDEAESLEIILQELVHKVKTYTFDYTKGAEVVIYDKDLKALALKMCGKYSDRKRLHRSIFGWSYAKKLAFLSEYLDGDGFFHIKQAYISSCNKNLLKQVQWLARSIGLNSTIGRNLHKAGTGFNYHDTTEWILRFRSTANEALSKYSIKVPNEPGLDNGGRGGPFSYRDFWLVRIDSITQREYDGLVYNLEVEEDNSYVVNDWAVHNCKISYDVCLLCNNKARTRADYCIHAKTMLGKLLPDGRRVGVANPNPRFFDMSIVTNEADKSSGYLAKVAKVTEENPFDESEETGIEKEIPTDDGVENLEDAIDGEEPIIEDVERVDEEDECFDEDLLETLSLHPLEKVMATMSGLGMKMKPREFTYLSLRPSLGGRGASIIFKSRKSIGPIVVKSTSKQAFVYNDDIDADIARLLLPEMHKRSFYPSYFIPRSKLARPKQPDCEIINNTKLAGVYSDYINTVTEYHPLKLIIALRKHAWLMPYINGDNDEIKEAFLEQSNTEQLSKTVKAGSKILYVALAQR